MPPIALNVAAVGSAELSGQENAGDQGEEDSQDVQGEENHGDGQSCEEGSGEAIETSNPGPCGSEHGIVNGLGGRTGAIDITGDDVADQGGDDERP